jgi:hypothetical protein
VNGRDDPAAGDGLDAEAPRGDEPYWFEQLRRDEAYEIWAKRVDEMALNVRNDGAREFKRVPQGIHLAVCDMVVDCGMQPAGRFRPRHQVYLRWEIPSERIGWTDRHGGTHEGPMSIGKFYTASLADKATLRRDLENWRGLPFTREELRGFDLFKVLGAACQLVVTHTTQGEETYANVSGIMGFPRDAPKPSPEYRLIRYSPQDPEQFDELPQWLREKVASALTAPADEALELAYGEQMQEELPFSRRTG